MSHHHLQFYHHNNHHQGCGERNETFTWRRRTACSYATRAGRQNIFFWNMIIFTDHYYCHYIMLLFTSGLIPYCHHDIIVIVSLLKKLYSYYNYLQWYYIHSVKPHFESIFYFLNLSLTATSWAGPGKAKAFGDKPQFQQRTQRILQGTSVSENIGHICGLWKYLGNWIICVFEVGKNYEIIFLGPPSYIIYYMLYIIQYILYMI